MSNPTADEVEAYLSSRPLLRWLRKCIDITPDAVAWTDVDGGKGYKWGDRVAADALWKAFIHDEKNNYQNDCETSLLFSNLLRALFEEKETDTTECRDSEGRRTVKLCNLDHARQQFAKLMDVPIQRLFKSSNTIERKVPLKARETTAQTKKCVMSKQQLPAAVRNAVWNQYVGIDLANDVCCCCGSERISRSNFECGHVISRSKGGSDKIENLRPICGLCNKSMGTHSMSDFIETYGFPKRDDVRSRIQLTRPAGSLEKHQHSVDHPSAVSGQSSYTSAEEEHAKPNSRSLESARADATVSDAHIDTKLSREQLFAGMHYIVQSKVLKLIQEQRYFSARTKTVTAQLDELFANEDKCVLSKDKSVCDLTEKASGDFSAAAKLGQQRAAQTPNERAALHMRQVRAQKRKAQGAHANYRARPKRRKYV
jgi:5-methylcytosine-specific restriction endonuclease McrA